MAKPVLQQSYQSRSIGSPNGDLISVGPGWLIRGVTIDNLSGSWLLIPFTGQWIPPYVLGWASTLRPGALSFSVKYSATGPGGQISTALGSPMSLTVYDSPILNSGGTAFLNQDGTPIAQGVSARRRQVFTSSGTWIRPNGVFVVTVSMIGGGGGGGGGVNTSTLAGGGGGAGDILIGQSVDVSGQPVGTAIPVTVGTGGAGGVQNGAASPGNPSSFLTVSTEGGGAGGSNGAGGNGQSRIGGGSGGGGSGINAGGPFTGGTALLPGHNGGNGFTGGSSGGGGGGLATAGSNSTGDTVAGNGGNGNLADTFLPYSYGGGGGGGTPIAGTPGTNNYGGGTGGIGNANGRNGTPNTGAGGGGVGATNGAFVGGNGGSGVVIIEWDQS